MSTPPPLWRLLLTRRMLFCLLGGFASGLPYFVLATLLKAWLRDEGVSLASIGLLSLAELPYTWKFLWAPAVDRWSVLGLGRRRGWALLTQAILLVAIAALGWLRPAVDLLGIGALALTIALASATQDVTLDAWRRELLPDEELGLGSGIWVNTWRLAGLVPGSLSLVLAAHLPWSAVYAITAAFVGVGLTASLLAPEPPRPADAPPTLREAVVAPFRELWERRGPVHLARLLAFLLLYKLGDTLALTLITPFYVDVGFSLEQIGAIAKIVGLVSAVVGALLAGAVMTRLGVRRSLWVFGVVQMLSIPGFAVLALVGPDPWMLGAAVAFEYLGVGLGTASFLAFLQQATDRRYTATQFALLTAVVALPRTVLASGTGLAAEALGWPLFFGACTLLALPGLAMLPWVAPWGPDPE